MEENFSGIIPVKKPVGFTTYDLIRIFKKSTGFNGKIGHGGTLDPFATGVVLLLLGEATKRFEEIRNWKKVYIAGIRLGISSDTGDIAGEIMVSEKSDFKNLKKTAIEEVLKDFIGEIKQKVPSYSAAKFGGTPMYKLARKGVYVEKTRIVKISHIELLNFKIPLLTIKVTCLGGVYIRQLAMDISDKIGYPGLLYFLERSEVGNFSIKDCYTIEDFEKLQLPEFHFTTRIF
ncbi:MAG: tRNA pseudouridine(55) synthase TruB [candidate division WOR-3 bacterium]